MSANIGLPPWKELIDEIAVQLDYDPEVFNTYGNFSPRLSTTGSRKAA